MYENAMNKNYLDKVSSLSKFSAILIKPVTTYMNTVKPIIILTAFVPFQLI